MSCQARLHIRVGNLLGSYGTKAIMSMEAVQLRHWEAWMVLQEWRWELVCKGPAPVVNVKWAAHTRVHVMPLSGFIPSGRVSCFGDPGVSGLG